MPGAGARRAHLVEIWVWRFRCRRCERTCSVFDPEVLLGHLYTLPAMLMAWFHAVAPPVGGGLGDAAVYALLGVDRRLETPEARRAGVRRWRSLGRWMTSAEAWWPTRSLTGTTWRERAAALLLGFVPGDGGWEGATRRAVSAHVAGGTAM